MPDYKRVLLFHVMFCLESLPPLFRAREIEEVLLVRSHSFCQNVMRVFVEITTPLSELASRINYLILVVIA